LTSCKGPKNDECQQPLVLSFGLFFLYDAASPVGASLCPSAPYQKDRLKLDTRTIDGDCIKPHDAYHPVGTCRMGEDTEAGSA